mgnify:CR=1 FL=1
MNIMEKRKKNLMGKRKEKAFHIKHNYKRFKSVEGYKFWAKDKKDAKEYCKFMNWVLGELDE